jgi:zinc transporter 1/2/3
VWAGGVITAVLVALAAGSFIYVAIVDILVEEFSNTKWKWAKLLLCICGLAFNTFISILFEED